MTKGCGAVEIFSGRCHSFKEAISCGNALRKLSRLLGVFSSDERTGTTGVDSGALWATVEDKKVNESMSATAFNHGLFFRERLMDIWDFLSFRKECRRIALDVKSVKGTKCEIRPMYPHVAAC